MHRSFDYGPATKLLPALELETDPNVMIITVDDDTIYPNTMIERFRNGTYHDPMFVQSGHCEFPKYRTSQKEFDTYYGYPYGPVSSQYKSKCCCQLFAAYGSTAYRGFMFQNDTFPFKKYMDVALNDLFCYKSDDLVFSNYLTMLGYKGINVDIQVDQEIMGFFDDALHHTGESYYLCMDHLKRNNIWSIMRMPDDPDLTDGMLIRGKVWNGKLPYIYYYRNGTKHQLINGAALEANNWYRENATYMHQTLLDIMPSGQSILGKLISDRSQLRNGDLIQGRGRAVYYYNEGVKHIVPSIKSFWKSNWSLDQVQTIFEYILSEIPEGNAYLSPGEVAPPDPTVLPKDGELMKGYGREIYLYKDGMKHLVPSIKLFWEYNWDISQVKTILQTLLEKIPTGSPVYSKKEIQLSDGMLLRGQGAKQVYYYKSSVKYPVNSIQIFWENNWDLSMVKTIPKVVIDDIKTGVEFKSSMLEQLILLDNTEETKETMLSRAYPTRIVLSMTTTPTRILSLEGTLKSLLSQTHPPDLIQINIPEVFHRTGEKYPEIDSIKIFQHPKILVHHSVHDYGPATKLVPTLETETDPNTLIITVDDDTIYPGDMVETYRNNSFYNPHFVLSGHCEWSTRLAIQKEDFDTIYGYTYGKPTHIYKDQCCCQFFAAYAGTGYRRSMFMNQTVPFNHYMSVALNNSNCIRSDDLVLSNYVTMLGYRGLHLKNPVEQELFGFHKDALHRQESTGHDGPYKRCLRYLRHHNMSSIMRFNEDPDLYDGMVFRISSSNKHLFYYGNGTKHLIPSVRVGYSHGVPLDNIETVALSIFNGIPQGDVFTNGTDNIIYY